MHTESALGCFAKLRKPTGESAHSSYPKVTEEQTSKFALIAHVAPAELYRVELFAAVTSMFSWSMLKAFANAKV